MVNNEQKIVDLNFSSFKDEQEGKYGIWAISQFNETDNKQNRIRCIFGGTIF